MIHPIFLGMLLALLLPWTLYAAQAGAEGRGPNWWKAVPWLNGLAVILTMSRGPQLVVGMTVFFLVFFRMPAWRRTLAWGSAAAVLVVAFGHSYVIEFLHGWSNERHRNTITIKGQPYEYSGTTHRLLQVRVFEDAALSSGWFGYGTRRVTTVPRDVPFVEPHLAETFYSIDNHYLITILRGGFAGVGLFLASAILVLIPLGKSAFARENPGSLLAAGLFGALCAELVLLSTVYMAPDFGFHLMFMFGIGGSLAQCLSTQSVEELPDRAVPFMRAAAMSRGRRLVTGHPAIAHPLEGSASGG